MCAAGKAFIAESDISAKIMVASCNFAKPQFHATPHWTPPPVKRDWPQPEGCEGSNQMDPDGCREVAELFRQHSTHAPLGHGQRALACLLLVPPVALWHCLAKEGALPPDLIRE